VCEPLERLTDCNSHFNRPSDDLTETGWATPPPMSPTRTGQIPRPFPPQQRTTHASLTATTWGNEHCIFRMRWPFRFQPEAGGARLPYQSRAPGTIRVERATSRTRNRSESWIQRYAGVVVGCAFLRSVASFRLRRYKRVATLSQSTISQKSAVSPTNPLNLHCAGF